MRAAFSTPARRFISALRRVVVSFWIESTRPLAQPGGAPAAHHIVGLLQTGCWAALPSTTIDTLLTGGRLTDFAAGETVYAEADLEALAVLRAALLEIGGHVALRVAENFDDGPTIVSRQTVISRVLLLA